MNYILKVFILLLYIKISLLTFLSSGISQINHLIYFQRLSEFIYQIKNDECSLSQGSNCFFTESSYIQSLKKENKTLKKDYIEKDWIQINNNVNIYSIQEIYDDLGNKIDNYIRRISNKNDEEQKLPTQENQMDITFDKYDLITVNNDLYLEKKTYYWIYNDKITLFIDGKIRLKYDKTKSKIIVKDIIDYPSKTYAIIESNKAILSLDGKKFKCISLYVRPKSLINDDNQKVTIIGTMSKNIVIEGFNMNKLVFSTTFRINYFEEKQWTKVMLPNENFINKLVIPGNLEIDNISLSIENNQVYDIQSLFYNDPKRKTIELITDKDI